MIQKVKNLGREKKERIMCFGLKFWWSWNWSELAKPQTWR